MVLGLDCRDRFRPESDLDCPWMSRGLSSLVLIALRQKEGTIGKGVEERVHAT